MGPIKGSTIKNQLEYQLKFSGRQNWSEKKKTIDNANKAVTSKTLDQTKKKIESEYKPIEEYKPSGSFLYGQSAMNSLEEKTKKILEVNTLNI